MSTPWRPAWTPAVFLAVSLLWTWPAWGTGGVPAQWPDALGAVWLIDATTRLLPTMHDPLSGWPSGAHYGRPDSFMLMLLATLLTWLPAAWVYKLVVVLGPGLSAWAAERLARQLGAAAPWSLLAGFGYAFGGLASTALVEGYAYHAFNPWLPLLAGAWLRTTAPTGTHRDGAWAALWFGLAWLSSAWLGLAALCLMAALAIARAVVERRMPHLRAWGATAALITPGLALYLWAFAAAGGAGVVASESAAPLLMQWKVLIVQISGPGFGIDARGHSQNHAISATCFALALVAPRVCADQPLGRVLFGAGLVCFALGMLPRLDPNLLASVLSPELATAIGASLLRFPARLSWGWGLCAGVLAALVVHRAAAQRPRAAWAVFGLLAVDLFVVQRLPARQSVQSLAAPSAYAQSQGAVLDLYPSAPAESPGWRLFTTNQACAHQVSHGRPITDHCLFTSVPESPRIRMGAWVQDRLLAGEGDAATTELARLGIHTLAVRPDLYLPADRARLTAGISALGAPQTASTDGGEHLVAITIPDPAPPDQAAARWSQWQGNFPPE